MSLIADIELFVFDWDGTLFDSTAIIVESIQKAAVDLGLPMPSRERAAHVIGLGLQDALRYAVPEVTPELVPKIVERYRHHYLGRDHELTLFEGIPELLQTMSKQGKRLAIATGKSRIGLERAFDGSGLKPLFEATRCADEGEPKPHPWMLRDLGQELDVPTDKMLMIGDTTHDLDLARNAGAAFMGVGYGAHDPSNLGAAPSRAVVLTVPELRALLVV
jgi:phosphoglycolate phosphatase